MRTATFVFLAVITAVSGLRADDESIRELVDGNRAFACDLYRQLAKEDGNLFFSPYSISSALAMTFAGARDETEVQMAEALRFPFGQAVLHPIFGELETRLAGLQNEGVSWIAANSLWPQQRYEFESDFLELVRRFYRADVFPVDYQDGDAVRLQINGWVEEKTREKIAQLIPPGVLSPLTRMVLINAVYFKGMWRTPFPEASTMDRPFYPATGTPVDIPTMHVSLSAGYGEMAGFQVLSLDYEGDQVTMLLVLPAADKTLPAIEKSLSPKMLATWEALATTQEVEVFLPRFAMTSQFSLADALRALGMSDAFEEGVANFSGMDGLVNNLFISDAIHKAFIEVNEEGTEAAAATGIIMTTRAMVPQEKPVFRADRPFLFFIKDKTTGSVLFMGRLNEPSV
ncbi:MAG TPA: serpin family protein [Kiritimatiellia bacterium]|nr:serpin family protein [Kiritimatiellia bacterium]HMO97921.1 serpin family protein [Kiritimatiellia bacterium]HMP95272.1 serpin family protein [Kiritimatiellia bacterium]